jgi:multiple sugar transport system ATP-binding protein
MASVHLDHVSRVFPGGVVAVEDLTLEIHDQEFLVIVGPSGCGKSTTLRLIAGLEQITSGEVHIGGCLVNRVPPKDRDIAMVFQNYALYPHLSVRRNLSFGLELRYGGGFLSRVLRRVFRPTQARDLEKKRAGIPARVQAAAKMLGIDSLLDRMPGQLSGGERQRVAMGRALVREPAVFLFDEPLSNLDARLRVGMRRELKQLHQQLATTMIYVTHDQVEAMTLGQRIAVMYQGRLLQTGTPGEVYDRPVNRFVAGFLGTPGMNFLRGRLEADSDDLLFRGSDWSLPVDRTAGERLKHYIGREITLGIRPEDIHLERTEGPSALLESVLATVSTIEPLGDSAVVEYSPVGTPLRSTQRAGSGRVEADSATRVAGRVAAREPLHVGEEVRVRFEMRRAHWFDSQSGESLARQSAGT